jgi:transposase
VRLRTLLRNRIHAVLADHGHGRPGGCWSAPGRAWLAALELPAASREVIDDDLALTGALQEPIDRLDGEVRRHARPDPQVKILTQLPGIGPFTALVILAEVGDITRFASARKLASWAGLTPTVRGSDRVAHHGHISKQGSVWLRWVLCEAAQTAKRHPDFAATYQAIARRRGKKIATTAIARKLLARAWHLLADAGNTATPSDQATPALRGSQSPAGGITKPRASSQKPMSRPRRAR